MSEIKFDVRRDGCSVIVSITPFRNVNLHLPLKWQCGNEIEAEAYYRLIFDGMRDRVLAIRKDAYARGYRDGRARKMRDEPIYGCINTEREERP